MKKAILKKQYSSDYASSYEITSLIFDSINHTVQTGLRHIYIDDNGLVQIQDTLHYFNENLTVNILSVDPAWTAESDPPKPADFNFDNPDTWGGLSIDQIPLIKKIQNATRLNELFTTTISASDELGYVIESNVLLFLQSKNVLPADYELDFKTL